MVNKNHEVIISNKNFPVLIEEDESGYFVATSPVLEGCYSQGKTIEEAMINIKEAIELCLEEFES